MKKFRNFLRQPRGFLSAAILPLFFVQSGCPNLITIFDPPAPPNQSCPVNAPLTLDARKCAVVEKPCSGSADWQRGDTFSITGTGTTGMPSVLISFDDGLTSNEIRLNDNFMRRVCQRPRAASTYINARASYEYTSQNNAGIGN